jgi:hypothetical protein
MMMMAPMWLPRQRRGGAHPSQGVDFGPGGQHSAVVDALQLEAAMQVGEQFGTGGRMVMATAAGGALLVVVAVVAVARRRNHQHHGTRAAGGGAGNDDVFYKHTQLWPYPNSTRSVCTVPYAP